MSIQGARHAVDARSRFAQRSRLTLSLVKYGAFV
jgi:hypothetical protein